MLSLGKPIFVKEELIRKAERLIASANSIVITAHKSPDGDAVGSSLALARYLNKREKRATVLLPDGFADFLRWMSGVDDIVYFDESPAKAKALIEEADLLFCLDYNVLSRTGKDMASALEARKSKTPFILIDHHQQPDTFPEVLISETTVCSTAQLVYQFITGIDGKEAVDAEIGACLYCGIMTDTGSFRFPSVEPETHEIAAHLLRIGVDHADIHRKVYDTNLLDRLKLVGYALSEKLVVLPEYHTAYITLSDEELKRFKYRPGDTEGLVNQALSIEGVNMAAFFRQGNNEVKLSLRSQGSFKVNEFASRYFNGGGHMNAAGGATTDSLEKVVERFLSALPEHKKALEESL